MYDLWFRGLGHFSLKPYVDPGCSTALNLKPCTLMARCLELRVWDFLSVMGTIGVL